MVVIADFSKLEVRLKALSVRFWGIPKGCLKPLQIKGFKIVKRNREPYPVLLRPKAGPHVQPSPVL